LGFTFTYRDVWSAAAAQYPRALDQPLQELATNIAINEMWKAYDWRGTVVQLPPFWLVPGDQDYGTPTYVIPDDYFGLREVYLVTLTNTTWPVRKKLEIVENLERTGLQDLPQSICYRSSIAGFRVHPCPTFSMAAPNYLIDGTYKKRPPKWTSASYASQLLWDDIYFSAFVSACVWAAFKLSGQRQAAMEQYLIFQQDLQRAKEDENLELGERVIHPTEGIAVNNRGILLWPW
jgi:hypothetical protein